MRLHRRICSMAAADGSAQAIAEGEPSPPRTDDLFDTEDALLVSETRASKRRSAKEHPRSTAQAACCEQRIPAKWGR